MMTQSGHNEPHPPSLKKRAATGAMWIAFETMGVQAISFVVFVVMARFVEPRDFGLISISFIAIQSLKNLMVDNISIAIVRKKSPTETEYTAVFWITIVLSILAFMALIALAAPAEWLFNASGLAPVVKAMSIAFLFLWESPGRMRRG